MFILCDVGWLIQKAEASSAYFKCTSLLQILRLSRDQMILPFLGSFFRFEAIYHETKRKVAEVHPAFPSLGRAMCSQMLLFPIA